MYGTAKKLTTNEKIKNQGPETVCMLSKERNLKSFPDRYW